MEHPPQCHSMGPPTSPHLGASLAPIYSNNVVLHRPLLHSGHVQPLLAGCCRHVIDHLFQKPLQRGALDKFLLDDEDVGEEGDDVKRGDKLAEIETNSRKMDRRLKEMEGPMKSQLRGARRKIEILEKKCHAGYFN